MTLARTGSAVVRLGPACVGALLAGVLAPGAGLAAAPTGGGGAPASVSISGANVLATSQAAGYWQDQQATGPYSNSSPAWGPEAGDHSSACVPASALSGVMASDDHHAILRFGRSVYYRLRMNKACPALVAPGAHVVSATRGGAMICEPDDVELKVASRDGAISRCPIYDMSRMRVAAAATPAQARAPGHH